MSDVEVLLAESDALHARVQRFVRGESDEGFSDLALAIAAFQARHSPGLGRLLAARGGSLSQLDLVPALPTDAFRIRRVALHPPDLDEVRFVTSGTTASARGLHAMRRTDTYRAIALSHGRRVLAPGFPARRVVIALAAHPGTPAQSSLGFMMRAFMEDFDGRALATDPHGAAFDPDSSARWLAPSSGLDVAGIRRAGLIALERGEPLLVLATSFAVVALLDELGGRKLKSPKQSTLMITGGFKGRARQVDPEKLRRRAARALGIPPSQVIFEYGMTELTSQLYEDPTRERPGVYFPPPWLEVTAIDPVSLRPVASGEVGLARFVDLGNVDSALAILTQDLIRARDGGVELVGRQAGAPLRGCALVSEQLVVGR